MRETRFISQNQGKWKGFEKNLDTHELPADQMEKAFVELNEDLSYAQTFYKNRAVRLFLNNLLSPFYNRIYKGKKWTINHLANFVFNTVPEANFASHRFMLFSFIIVMLGFLIGYFSTQYDYEFANIILGYDYVSLTENNIAKGDPLAIYKSDDAGGMFSAIALNNLKVAAYFFLFGALFCVGALYLLLSNGIVLGAFTFIFTSKGLTTEYLLTVYQHGTLEILTMVVEGAAGLMLGAGLLFPGTYTRLRSMQTAAKKGISIFLICVPIIILAAFIESYLTRFTELPTLFRILIIGLSLLIIVYYFIVFPWLRYRNGQTKHDSLSEPATTNAISPMAGKIYTPGQIILFGFEFIRKQMAIMIVLGMFASLGLYHLVEWLSDGAIASDIKFQLGTGFSNALIGDEIDVLGLVTSQLKLYLFQLYAVRYFFSSEITWLVTIGSFIIMFTINVLVIYYNKGLITQYGGILLQRNKIFIYSAISAIIQVVLNYLAGPYWSWIMLLVYPANLLLITLLCINGSGGFYSGIYKSLKIAVLSIGRYLTMVMILCLMYFIIMFGIIYFIATVSGITRHFHGVPLISEGMMKLYTMMNYFILPFFLAFWAYVSVLMALSLFERHTGHWMKAKIEKMAFRKEIYGMETEA